ncbi:MAG: exonuclease domain-containing protein [Pseudomonadota bacterium]
MLSTLLPALLPADHYRRWLLGRVEEGPLKSYLQTPLPGRRSNIHQCEFLALDFETTGLDARQEAILSIGYTLLSNSKILMRNNGHHLVMVNKSIPEESVIIHKITDDRARQGIHLHDVMPILLQQMAGRVILVHYGAIERNFLNAACLQLYGYRLPMLIADTLQIEKNRLQRSQTATTVNQLRLFNLRRAYGLPRYNAHSALEDAIATAELFLAQVGEISSGKSMPLKYVLS